MTVNIVFSGNLVGMAPRFLQFTQPEVRGHERSMSADLEVRILARPSRREHFFRPPQRFVEIVLREVMNPQAVENRQVALCVTESTRQPPCRLEHIVDFRRGPTMDGHENGRQLRTERELGYVPLIPFT